MASPFFMGVQLLLCFLSFQRPKTFPLVYVIWPEIGGNSGNEIGKTCETTPDLSILL
jgi:hypothetical protein